MSDRHRGIWRPYDSGGVPGESSIGRENGASVCATRVPCLIV